MPIGSPSVKKKLKGDLDKAGASVEKAGKDYAKALAKQREVCLDFDEAKAKMSKAIKDFGEQRYGDLMSGKQQPTDQDREGIKVILKLSDVVMKFSESGDIVTIDNIHRLVRQAEKDYTNAQAALQGAQKELDDYVQKKADLKNKGQKNEYAEWKKVLRAKLFAK